MNTNISILTVRTHNTLYEGKKPSFYKKQKLTNKSTVYKSTRAKWKYKSEINKWGTEVFTK